MWVIVIDISALQCARTWTLFLSRFVSRCLDGEGPRHDDDPRTLGKHSCCMAPPACKRILIESIIVCARGQRGVSSRDGRLQTGYVSYTHIGTRSQRRKHILYYYNIIILFFASLNVIPPRMPVDAFNFHETGESASCTLPDQIPIEQTRNVINNFFL